MQTTIRTQLLLLVLAVLMPAALGVAWLIGSTFQAERDANTRTLRDSARALSMVVDRELRQRSTMAQVLAQSRWLDEAPALASQHLERFDQLVRRSMNGMEGWVELRSASRVLLDTRRTPEDVSTTPRAPAPEAPLPFADTRQILPLRTRGDADPDAHAAVVEPVQRHGVAVLNLVVTLRPSELQRIIDKQNLPAGWVGTVLDNRGNVVARHPGGSANIGRQVTADLRARLAADAEGLFESVSLDGQRTTGYFSTSPQGWTYISAMPREQFAGLLPQAVLQIAVGALVLLGLAMLGATWVSRRIVGPVSALKSAAVEMQAGRPVTHHATGIVECDEVARALVKAAEAIQQGRRELEHQVAEAVARTRLAEQRVANSQRVEALGRLTGGVAHDFNNLLGVISNSAHLIQRHPAAAELQVPVAATLRAVEVGSQLTQHLLRFAGRQPVRPQAVELGRYLPELQELMRTVLGRRIEISVHVAADTAPVHVDSGELELALINLALNARDAMPAGGELRLQARNAQPDDGEDLPGVPQRRYVLITVSDDGVGIEPELAARVFEPFFTTKAVGKGSGLGLSQVHGFCVQAGGVARLASTPGLGTTVSLLLPAYEGAARSELAAAQPSDTANVIAGARVLLVEDNDELARVTVALLQSHGAVVERAADAAQALHRMASPADLDVVLSDVVMPGDMDGLALARQIRRQRPALPVVLISGYSHAASAATDFVVLRKPCDASDLLRALQQALAGAHRPLGAAAQAPSAAGQLQP